MPDIRTQAILKHNFLFRGLPDETIDKLADLAHRESFAKGQLIFAQGTSGDSLYGIASGRVRIFTADDKGHEIFLNELGPGQTFGEIALLDGLERTASAVAIATTQLVAIPRTSFLSLMERDTGLSLQMMKLLCERLRWISKFIEESTLLTGPARVAARVASLVVAFGTKTKDNRYELQISQADLARFLGISRQVVNHHLGHWSDNGCVDLRRGRIIVPDIEQLKNCSGPPH